MLSLLTGTVGKYAMYAGLVVMAMGGVAVLKTQYDVSIISKVAAKEAAESLAVERADNARIIAELQTRAVTAEADAAYYASIKGAIAHAQTSNACIRSPAIRSTIDGLRSNASRH